MAKLFGTDGVRGVAGEFPLDQQTVAVIGGSLTRHLSANAAGSPVRFVIGRDTRESGPEIEAAFTAGANAAGAEVTSAGVITTPGVAYLAGHLGFDAGVVISASHNPFHDNGIKVFLPSGRKLDAAVERLIEKDIEEAKGNATPMSSIEPKFDPELDAKYLDHLSTVFPELDLAGLKIVLDCANGAASALAPSLFTRLGATVVAINDSPDGRNINDGCGSLHLEGLERRVVAERADLGIAFDGDADRSLFVNGAGERVDGDATMFVIGTFLAGQGKLKGDVIVATVMSNLGLEIALRERSIKLDRTDVGDKYVLEELLSSGASIGGEQSGHLIFPELSLSGDGMLTSLFLLQVMRATGRGLAELAAPFQRYPQILKNVIVREKLPFADVPAIAAAASQLEAELGSQGRLLLRYSGTEPLARIMIEGKEQAAIDFQAEKLAAVIRDEIGHG